MYIDTVLSTRLSPVGLPCFLYGLQVSVGHRPGQVQGVFNYNSPFSPLAGQGSGGGGAHALVHHGHAAGHALN